MYFMPSVQKMYRLCCFNSRELSIAKRTKKEIIEIYKIKFFALFFRQLNIHASINSICVVRSAHKYTRNAYAIFFLYIWT